MSAHLVIAQNGVVHETLPCWDGIAYRGGHAGVSRWLDNDKVWQNFNDFSLGIEIENRNGNLFAFTESQYEALGTCLDRFKEMYPSLRKPERLVGHEHIAGWRGKVDP